MEPEGAHAASLSGNVLSTMTFTLPSEMRSATFCSCAPTHGQHILNTVSCRRQGRPRADSSTLCLSWGGLRQSHQGSVDLKLGDLPFGLTMVTPYDGPQRSAPLTNLWNKLSALLSACQSFKVAEGCKL